jgi:hypothetical protein
MTGSKVNFSFTLLTLHLEASVNRVQTRFFKLRYDSSSVTTLDVLQSQVGIIVQITDDTDVRTLKLTVA